MTLHRAPQPFRDLPPDEAAVAAERLEWRAQAPASQAMFDALVAPLLPTTGRVLEVGAGTAPLARKAMPPTRAQRCWKRRHGWQRPRD